MAQLPHIFKPEKNRFLFLLIILFATFLTLALLSEGSYGGADDIVHFRFAYFSFRYPYLLLDHWAKPIFTLLAAPFAQLGYGGVKCFNILAGCFTGFLLWKISQILNIKRSWMSLPILFFMPVYTSMLLSGMTEILFSTILTLAAFFFLKKKYFWSAVVISFLPIARTEGIVIWPVYIFAFLWYRQWKAIPWMLTAAILYSLIGGFYFHDFLWLINRMPYSNTYDIYGHGELLHFVRATKLIFGIPAAMFFIVGIVSLMPGLVKHLFQPMKNNKFIDRIFNSPAGFPEIIILLLPVLVFYAAHSYVWWKGISSLGLIRVMACIAPPFAIFSLRGINAVTSLFSSRWVQYLLVSFILLWIVITPFKVLNIPVPLSETELLIKKAARWYSESPYKHRKFYIADPYFYFFLYADPYDSRVMADGIPDRHKPESGIKPGEMVVWESHFLGHDSKFPIESLLRNPFFKPVKTFYLMNYQKNDPNAYFMCMFERLAFSGNQNNEAVLDSLIQDAAPKYTEKILLTENFEIPSGKPDLRYAGKPHSGQFCLSLTPSYQFYTLVDTLSGDMNISANDQIEISLSMLHNQDFKPLLLVISQQNKKDTYNYQSFELKDGISGKWEDRKFRCNLQKPQNEHDKLSIYFWNLNKDSILIDDVSIKFFQCCKE